MFARFIKIDGKEISFLKKVIEEKSMIFYFFSFNEIPGCDYKEITNYIKSHNIDINNGDVIVFDDPDTLYRNAGKCIWYNDNAISLSSVGDEYGEVPSYFEISPNIFHPRYWTYVIMHNNNYWPCNSYREQCCINITKSSNDIRYTWFFHNNVKEYVVLETDLDILDDKFKELLLDISKPYNARYYEYRFLDDMHVSNTSTVYYYQTTGYLSI